MSHFHSARVWSNHELRRIAGSLAGDIVNVSGSEDLDKEGGRYRDYFANASSYTITNYKGFRERPEPRVRSVSISPRRCRPD